MPFRLGPSPNAPSAPPGCARTQCEASLSGRKSPQESSLQADLPLQDLSPQPSDRLMRPAHLVKVYSYSVASEAGRLAPRPFQEAPSLWVARASLACNASPARTLRVSRKRSFSFLRFSAPTLLTNYLAAPSAIKLDRMK